ncbi:hypothetical protein PM082_018673 [Marasmius tenuissimus]|nr:hypothetical protein PM082_018673 [Marasmius tenuissimus]
MRRRRLFTLPFIILLEIFLLSSRLGFAVPLRIEPPLPPTVTALQPVTFSWIRESGDPKLFGFQKLPTERPPSETFTVSRLDSADSGAFTLTFTQARSYAVVALDLDSKPSIFFTAPNTVLAALSPEPRFPGEQTGINTGSSLDGAAATSPPDSTSSPGPTAAATSTSPPQTSTTTSKDSKNSTPMIVGGAVGGVVFLLLFILAMILLCRRCRRRFTAENESLFHRDKMVLQKPIGSADGYGYDSKEKERANNGTNSDTTLLEGSHKTEAPRDSISMSIYSRESAVGTRIRSSLASIGTPPAPANVSVLGHDRLVESPAPLLYASERPLSPLRSPSRARTDRQMQIEKKVFELQGRLITVTGSGQEKTRAREALREKIDKVKQLKDSDWALQEGPGSGGEVPAILRD